MSLEVETRLRFWLCGVCAELQPDRVPVADNWCYGDSIERHCEFCKDRDTCTEFDLLPSITALAAAGDTYSTAMSFKRQVAELFAIPLHFLGDTRLANAELQRAAVTADIAHGLDKTVAVMVERNTTECNECPAGDCSDCPRKWIRFPVQRHGIRLGIDALIEEITTRKPTTSGPK